MMVDEYKLDARRGSEGFLEAKSKLNDPDYGTRKLAHYNMWLLDPNRKPYPEGRYPGFPEDVEQERAVAAYREEFVARAETKAAAKAAKPKMERAPKVKRASKTEGPTKQDRAVEIYKRLDGVKGDVIQMIQAELGMSLAGATTYFYNAKKLA
jgi:hypothetical protein